MINLKNVLIIKKCCSLTTVLWHLLTLIINRCNFAQYQKPNTLRNRQNSRTFPFWIRKSLVTDSTTNLYYFQRQENTEHNSFYCLKCREGIFCGILYAHYPKHRKLWATALTAISASFVTSSSERLFVRFTKMNKSLAIVRAIGVLAEI